MTEEEFFMGIYEIWNLIDMPSAHSLGLLVGIFSVGVAVVFIGSIAYIAIGETTKTFKRRVSQRAINPLVSIRSHKNIPPPERKP